MLLLSQRNHFSFCFYPTPLTPFLHPAQQIRRGSQQSTVSLPPSPTPTAASPGKGFPTLPVLSERFTPYQKELGCQVPNHSALLQQYMSALPYGEHRSFPQAWATLCKSFPPLALTPHWFLVQTHFLWPREGTSDNSREGAHALKV